MNKLFIASIALTALSACGGASTSGTSFPIGEVPAPPAATYVGDVGTVRLLQGGGFTFAVPFNGLTVAPQANLLPTPIPALPPTSGTTEMTGRFDLVRLTDLTVVGDLPTGTREQISGPMTLAVTFGAAGTNAIITAAGDLTVNATYDPANQNRLAGTVSYQGVAGAVSGLMGADQALGVFQGSQETTAYAGGFAVVE